VVFFLKHAAENLGFKKLGVVGVGAVGHAKKNSGDLIIIPCIIRNVSPSWNKVLLFILGAIGGTLEHFAIENI